MSPTDRIFSEQGAYPGGFRFDEKVVRVFPDMILRSVPGYELVIPMTGMLARRYAQADSRVYDLGCSLGAATLAMRRAIRQTGVSITAIDNSPAMVKRCRTAVEDDNSIIPVDVIEADIRDIEIRNASVVAMNYTLQFVPKDERVELIGKIASGLRPGGVLLLSEKVRFSDDHEQDLQTRWHQDFKRAQGYSDLEIAGKRTALENVLVPDTGSEHMARLKAAGFSNVTCWFRCFSFSSYVANR